MRFYPEVLYELLTGEIPYPAGSTVAVAMRHLNDPVPSVRERRTDVSPRLDGLVRRAMAKDPVERFPSMDALIAALEACMAEEAGPRASDDGATQILRPVRAPRAEPRREPESRPGRRPPWRPLAGLAVLAAGAGLVGALATGRLDPTEDGGTASTATVRLRAVDDYDPEGGDGEHPELVKAATDRDPKTYWRTETYGDFEKSGVGIVLDAGRPAALSRLVVVSDTPGFEAKVQAGRAVTGPFADVSGEAESSGRTTFELDTEGRRYRYYVVWITSLEEVAHVNEVRAG